MTLGTALISHPVWQKFRPTRIFMCDLLMATSKEGLVEETKLFYGLMKAMEFVGNAKVLFSVLQLFLEVSERAWEARGVASRRGKGDDSGLTPFLFMPGWWHAWCLVLLRDALDPGSRVGGCDYAQG